MSAYLDTSAALKVIVTEAESAQLRQWLDDYDGEVVASRLLHTELHCAAFRGGQLPIDGVTAVLDSIVLVDLAPVDLDRAATSRWGLRSADAIHLATALRLGVETMVTYDHELREASVSVGLRVASPGA